MPAPRVPADACAVRLKVLADRTRLAVMEHLLRGPLHVAELHREIDIDQSLLSHHLRVLREAGLVEAERDGKTVLYRISPAVVVRRARRQAIDLGCCRIDFD